jgi:hypothetical protein
MWNGAKSMTDHSEQLNELAAALAKAQAQMHAADADAVAQVERDGSTQTYRYATLASVWNAARKPLTKNGLALLQTCEPGNRGELRLTTTLLHESGQWVSGTEVVPISAPTPQSFGSALTYARRYGLAAMVGLCVNEDDDGLAASISTTGQPERPAAASRGTSKPATGRSLGQPATACIRESWQQVPYNRATEAELKAFAKAYAEMKGLESIGIEDIRRDFRISGKLTDHFGATTLGQILERASCPKPDEGGDASELAPREAA